MDLKSKAIRSTAWYGGTRLVTQVVSWATTIVVARILAPVDYGLYAMAFAVITFLELFQEFGLGVAIIQRKTLTNRQINSIFWLLMGVSAGLVSVAVLAAPAAARFYHEPRLVPVIRALGFTFLFSSLGTVPLSLLTKEIDFKRRSFAEGAGVLVAALVSIALAHMGLGYWALVGGQVTRVAVRNTGMMVLARWWPRFEFEYGPIRDAVRFGLHVAGSTVIKEVSPLVNTAILGRFLGGAPVGLFSMAMTLGLNPLHTVSTAIITQIALPVFSKLQDDLEGLRSTFLRLTKYLAVLTFPMQAGLAFVAPDLVEVFLSPRWRPIVGILRIFCLGGIFYVLPLPSTPLLTAQGHVRKVFYYSAAFGVGMAVAMLVGVRFGLSGVALAWGIAFPLLRASLLVQSMIDVRLPAWRYLRTVGPSLSAAALMIAALFLANALIHPAAAGGRLALDVAVGAVVYSGALVLFDRGIVVEFLDIARTLFQRGKVDNVPAALEEIR
ncbi:MAG TPA: lipopolysaccharide biosynthesis protein [Candidatus Eisenbacteria bacterium]